MRLRRIALGIGVLVCLAGLIVYLALASREPTYTGPFEGVVGTYTCTSELSDTPSVVIKSVDDGRVVLDVTGTGTETVYYRNLTGRITGKSEAELPIDEADVRLRLNWENPGTLHIECIEGKPSGAVRELLKYPTYWNSAYLHTS